MTLVRRSAGPGVPVPDPGARLRHRNSGEVWEVVGVRFLPRDQLKVTVRRVGARAVVREVWDSYVAGAFEVLA